VKAVLTDAAVSGVVYYQTGGLVKNFGDVYCILL